MNNKQMRKPKNKNSKKHNISKNKKGNTKKDKFSIQDDQINLLSSSMQNYIDEQLSEVYQQLQHEEIQDNIQPQKTNKSFKINNQRFALVVEINKYYQFKVQQEQTHKICLQVYSNKYSMNINGKNYQVYTPQQSFILKTQQNKAQSATKTSYYLSLEEETQQFRQFTKSVNQINEIILISNKKINFQNCRSPWLKIPPCINEDSLMVIGSKNTGKSSLCEYLLNTRGNHVVLLDCDIGRNVSMEGCISLTCANITKKIWIGQLTPLNNLQTYLRAIKYLFKFYRQQWFTKQLIVNTMGYTSGLGQFLLYQIFQIVKPQSVLVLKSPQATKLDNLNNIIRNIQTGQYLNRLYISKIQVTQQFPTTTKFTHYQNEFAVSKKLVSRYQKMFQCSNKKVSNITQLLTLIHQSHIYSPNSNRLNSKCRTEIPIYEQSRHNKQELQGIETVRYRLLSLDQDVNMRLIVLGKMINQDTNTIDIMQENNLPCLFQVQSLGFGYDNVVYSAGNIEGLIGIVSQGIDFEKGFYHLNQKQLIDLELRYGRLNYIMVATQGMGSKGMRNNPSKTQ